MMSLLKGGGKLNVNDLTVLSCIRVIANSKQLQGFYPCLNIMLFVLEGTLTKEVEEEHLVLVVV